MTAMSAHPTFVVGLTGGIATGKSRVANLLEDLGAGVVCSDRLVREIQAAGSEALDEIAESFGAEYILASGELDRAGLGALIFQDADARQRLNSIIHPRVTQKMAERLEAFRQEGVPVVVLDIPLLLEGKKAGRGTGALLPFDEIVVVYANEQKQVERLMARDRLSPQAAIARVHAQMPIEEKRAMADVVIDNGGDWQKTEEQVRELYQRWASRPCCGSPD
jgi:dephospho-CoA kinase